MDSTFLRACEASIDRFGVPALQLALVDPDGTLDEARPRLQPDDRFRIASITKPVTASAAVQLLDLDAPTGVWPEDVRVRHLLSHSSGFESELGRSGPVRRRGRRHGRGGRRASGRSPARRSRRALLVRELGLLARGLADGAGRRDDATRTPSSSMSSTRPACRARGSTSRRSPGRAPMRAPRRYPRARRPSGGLVSCAADVAAFGRWQLASPWAAALRTPQVATAGGDVYGFGFGGERVGGVEVWGHGGSHSGFRCQLLVVPDRGAVFAGLTNSGRGKLALREIEDLWLERVVGARRPVPATVELGTRGACGFHGPLRERRVDRSRPARRQCDRRRVRRGRRAGRGHRARRRACDVRDRRRRLRPRHVRLPAPGLARFGSLLVRAA